VLEYTYKLRQQDEQLGDVWMLLRSAARGGETLVENTSALSLLRAAHGDIFALIGILNGEDADRSTSEAFAQYEKDKKLKSAIRQDLQKLRISYRQYLEDYTPICKKYMQEYDALCIEKDKAYLDLYAGRTDEAMTHTQNILRKYPDNAEAMLLQSMSHIMLGAGEVPAPDVLRPLNPESPDSSDSLEIPESPARLSSHYAQAQSLLQRYTELYPGRTAPALVLEGLMQQQLGNEQAAMSRFHQASVEYPRQAAQLTDMLDAYNNRNYLNQTPEGQYLRRLYASTMEGYGLFSPNLLKAKYYADKGQMEQSREEIYNHFFRRGNQGIYDEVLSDMQFC
jgi:tetratricopeptide (TPR) repeat protein